MISRQSDYTLAIIDIMHSTPDAAKRPSVAQRSDNDTNSQKQPLPRRLRLPKRTPFRLKRIKHPVQLPSSWQLTKKTYQLLWQARRPLLGIFLVYVLLSILLVRGFGSSGDVNALRQQLGNGLNGNAGELAGGLTSLTNTLTSANAGSTASAGVYQLLLGILVSLATIWTLRQVLAGERVRVRDAFYKSTGPFITFLLVLLVILIQIVPFIIGGGIYTVAVNFGIAVTAPERLLWGVLFAALAATSIYMLCASTFGLYIVTLPDMTPLKALRSARNLVQYRRAAIFRKLLFLAFVLGVIAVTVLLPLAFIIPTILAWVFFLGSLAALIVINTYMYTLYRELLA